MSTHNICFFLRNKKDISIFWMKKAPYLLLGQLYMCPLACIEKKVWFGKAEVCTKFFI